MKKPIYFGQLRDDQRRAAADLVQTQRNIPDAIDYAQAQYDACEQLKIKLDALIQLRKDEPFALVMLRAA